MKLQIYNLYELKAVKQKYSKFKELTKGFKISKSSFTTARICAYMKNNFQTIHYKMVLTQLYTTIDEFLSKLIKACIMYYDNAISAI